MRLSVLKETRGEGGQVGTKKHLNTDNQVILGRRFDESVSFTELPIIALIVLIHHLHSSAFLTAVLQDPQALAAVLAGSGGRHREQKRKKTFFFFFKYELGN